METTRGAVRRPSAELSHEERDACLHELGAMHASGELSIAELEARIEGVFAATTRAELATLVRGASRIEVAPPRPIFEEPASAPSSRRADGWLFALRLVFFVVLTLLVGLVRLVALAVVAFGAAVVRALLVAAWGGWLVCQAVARRCHTWRSHVRHADARTAPVPLQLRRAPSRELVLTPRPQVPAQREPVKIHPVLVPTEGLSSESTLVLASRSADMMPGRAAVPREVLVRNLSFLSGAAPHEDRGVRGLVSQLRPLVHRVAERARWRQVTTNACERAARAKGWRRTVGFSRTAF